MKALWRLTAGFHKIILLRTLIGIVRVGIMLAVIWLSKTAVDCAIGYLSASPESLIGWFALLAVGMILDMLLARWVSYIESRSYMRMNIRLTRRFYNILMALPNAKGQQAFHSGDMLNRLTIDIPTISKFTLFQVPTMAVLAVQLVASFIFLASLNIYLALVPIIVMPICILAGKMYFRRQRRITADIRDDESRQHICVQEGLRHRLLLKTLECSDVVDAKLGNIQSSLDNSNRRQTLLSARSSTLIRLGFIIGYLAAFGWSIFSLRAGLITFGTMTAFIQLVSRIQSPIAGISGYLPAIISTTVAIDRLREIDLPVEESHGVSAPLARAGVRVDDLSFSYREDGEAVISRFSYDFAPGSRTMVVGHTGIGKTTLIKLLLGLLEPDAGRVTVYNDDHTESVSSATLGNFVYVPQGNSLLHGTIRENLLLAKPDAADEEIAEALQTAVADFVYDLPQGLETPCDESGGGMSEGQAQRIAIARALLRPGSILLLDEFNSALDGATAATLMERLCAARPDATIIIIAHHRDAVAPYCDAILPLPHTSRAE